MSIKNIFQIIAGLCLVIFIGASHADTRKAVQAYEQGNYQKAYREFLKSAKKGDQDAQYNLAVMLYKGRGISRDKAAAIYWFVKAAEKGDASAQYNLGVLYSTDKDLPREYPKMDRSGDIYFEVSSGKSSSNMEKAAHWYKKAAEQGHVTAQLNLGVIYNQGSGVKKDYTEAAKWYKKAAEKGNSKAQLNLGILYDQGMGVEKDIKQALKMYKKAAIKGVRDAQYNLGILYYNGEGVKKDLIESYAWLRIAEMQGSQLAKVYRQRVHEKMKNRARKRAKKLAEKYKKKYVDPFQNI